ncbi:MAG: hypothetical protein ACLUOI_29280 [Eisenbergiella sp.]
MECALKKGLPPLLTDHDTTDGIRRAAAAAEGSSLLVIPGIELSTEYHGSDAHSGAWHSSGQPAFRNYLQQFRRSRDLRNEK